MNRRTRIMSSWLKMMKEMAGHEQIIAGGLISTSPVLRSLGANDVTGVTRRPLFSAAETMQHMRLLQQKAPKEAKGWMSWKLPPYQHKAVREERSAVLREEDERMTAELEASRITPKRKGLEYFFDGSTEGEGAGAGALLLSARTTKWEATQPMDPSSSNNEAEYEGLLLCLRHLVAERGKKDVAIYGDSTLVVEQVHGRHRCKHPALVNRHREAQQLYVQAQQNRTVTLQHVYRKHNKLADQLARQAALESAAAQRRGSAPEAPV